MVNSMRWVKISEEEYVNLDLASNITVKQEKDYTVKVGPNEDRPRRQVVRIYFPQELENEQVSVAVFDAAAQSLILDLLEVMANDTVKAFSDKSRPRAGIKSKGQPLEVDPPEGH